MWQHLMTYRYPKATYSLDIQGEKHCSAKNGLMMGVSTLMVMQNFFSTCACCHVPIYQCWNPILKHLLTGMYLAMWNPHLTYKYTSTHILLDFESIAWLCKWSFCITWLSIFTNFVTEYSKEYAHVCAL